MRLPKDVGGGCLQNGAEAGLADISLRWMVREVISSQCGILFKDAVTSTMNVQVDLPAETFTTPASSSSQQQGPFPSTSQEPASTGSDASLDTNDCVKPLHDQLKARPIWWLLEVVPFLSSYQDEMGNWHRRWGGNHGRGRIASTSVPLLFHETVRLRMENEALNYNPKAQYRKGEVKYVW